MASSLLFLLEEEEWMERGTCRVEKADPSIFILDQGYTAAEAKTYCKRCPVKQPCLEYARRTHSIGVWGDKVFSFKPEEEDYSPLPILDQRPRIERVVYFEPGEEPGIFADTTPLRKPGIFA